MKSENTGIVYLMDTAINGVCKIGAVNEHNFESKMNFLEKNGYANVVGLKRLLAIKTENYRDKEEILHNIFAKSRIGDTELFAVDKELIIKLYSALCGDIIYPKNNISEDIFDKNIKNKYIIGTPPGINKGIHRSSPKFEQNIKKTLVDFVKYKHRSNPRILKDLLGDKDEYKIPNTNIRVFKRDYFGKKSGVLLTNKIDDGVYIYTNFSQDAGIKAKNDYMRLYNE